MTVKTLALSLLAIGLVLLSSFDACAAPRRPNIMIILTEDQGAQVGFVGTPGLQTPHMDSIARSGVYFNNAFVAYPVCSASKAAMYTGLHNHTNGILNNTPNYHKPADQLTQAERSNALYRRNRIRDEIPTLVQRLKAAGYYQGVTHKLHVAPVEKFPYDEFIQGQNGKAVEGFITRASKTGKPWHLLYNISVSHRPFPNSDKVAIRVKPEEVKLPAYLPDTSTVRKDWAEYLAAIEKADQLVGEGLDALRAADQEANTIVVLMGDHGPCFQHGKMTLYDLGLRVPLAIRVPWLPDGRRTDALASELDLTPTLLDLLEIDPLPRSHGISLRPVLEARANAAGHDFIFAEISDRGPLPNDGMQERSVFDGRWHLIYREKMSPPWRQVQADSKQWKLWGNRTYAETLRVREQFPEAYRILAEMDPQSLGGTVPVLELYDLQSDPDEMNNLVNSPEHCQQRDRLYAALQKWVKETADPAVAMMTCHLINGVSSERMSDHVFYLAKDPLPLRKLNYTLPGHEKNTLYEADDYLIGKLESRGYRVHREGVQVQAFRCDTRKPKHAQYSAPKPGDPWYTAYNLYAEKKGSPHPEQIILILAHKDSQSWVDSPGANDNAIGTAGVLEIAWLLADYDPQRTIRFLFCNEEHTPWTSVTAAKNAKTRGDDIIAVFNTDGIGVKNAEDTAAGKKMNVTAYTDDEAEPLARLMERVNRQYAIGLEQRSAKRPRPGDDDGSFVKAGYTRAVINIGSWPYGDPNYHAEGDISERCDMQNAALAVKAILAAVVTIDQEGFPAK